MSSTHPTPFDFSAEMAKLDEVTGKLRELIAAGKTPLSKAVDFGVRCSDVEVAAEDVAQELPPPEPTPPTTKQKFTYQEYRLVSVRAAWLARFRKLPHPIDVDNRIPRPVMVEKTVTLADPRMPGSPPTTVEMELEFNEVVQVPLPKPGKTTGDRPEKAPEVRLPLGSISRHRTFRYEMQKTRKKFTIPVDAVPPDAPLTVAQQAYVDRKKEIAEEVWSIGAFIKMNDAKVRVMEEKTASLERDVKRLVEEIDDLPDLESVLQELEERDAATKKLHRDLEGEEKMLDEQRKKCDDMMVAISSLLKEA